MRRPPPDFVIVGAPKCGTTAIYRTLQLHPSLFLPSIKEPHYFASEYGKERGVETSIGYDRLFAGAQATRLCGEGSIMYLSSPGAIPAILRRRRDVKIIATVRNPIELFVSWHNQCMITLDEDEADPEHAWRIQELRAAGQMIPKSCHEPRSLQCRNICAIGAQIERLFELVPESQRLVLILDDLEQQPRTEYKRIAEFLGVEDDGKTEFLRENGFARPRSRMIARLARAVQIYQPLKTVRLRLKPALNKHGIYWVERIFRSNLIPVGKPALPEPFWRELMAEFLPDIILLEKLLDRDLSEWRKPPRI